jgi:ABC-type nickel/cobalt efflux system permease component RcnA
VSDTVANLASLLFLGFFLGMRHATDADHVVAIATIVSRQRTLRGSALIGGAWGIGHTLTILVVGGAVILFGVVIPARVGLAMELAVGIMLVLLGLLTLTGLGRVIREAAGSHAKKTMPEHAHGHGHDHVAHAYPHDHAHAHGDYVHQHAHGHGAEGHGHPEDQTPLARIDRWLGGLSLYHYLRPLVVGIVHGLAGSAAVALLVLAAVRDPGWAMAYLLLFGAGTILGMMLITMALAAPFAFSRTTLPRFNWQLRVASGLISFGFGLLLIYEIGFAAGGLFTAAPTWQPS